jgi:uncharacterized protein YcsI (UPF0317 family)
MTTATTQTRLPDRPMTGLAARLAIRRGNHVGPTSGLAPGFVQANLAILPEPLAEDFSRFCALNPKPCPLLGVAAPGDFRLPALGEDLDIRTDLPRYRVWRDGALSSTSRETSCAGGATTSSASPSAAHSRSSRR